MRRSGNSNISLMSALNMLEIVFMVGSFNLRSDFELTLLDTSSLIVFDGT